MSDFFNSEIVQDELNEINDLQKEIYGDAFNFPLLSRESRLKHIDRLKNLLERRY